jgi:hypothetical protein
LVCCELLIDWPALLRSDDFEAKAAVVRQEALRIAGEEYQGREPGTSGSVKAQNYIIERMRVRLASVLSR